MAKTIDTQKKLKKLIALQDCLDTQYCRSLNKSESDCDFSNTKEIQCQIQIPEKSPLNSLKTESFEKEKGSFNCKEVCEVLQKLDGEILQIAGRRDDAGRR